VALVARHHADPVTAGDVPPTNGAARSHDRSTVRLRRLSRTVAPGADRKRAGDESQPPQTGREIARSVAPGAPEPVARTTDGARLAALTGGSLVSTPDGRASVVLASGGQQPAAPARLARAATTATMATPHRALPEPVPATGSIDVDELYDQIASRLRREMLLDRERAGEMP
jgi:hypothetical protein